MNAFAIPGGHFFINTGLITALRSEKELAGILAHEIAHVSCRHISKNIKRSNNITLASAALLLIEMLTEKTSRSVDLGNAIIATSLSATDTITKIYSRENERQADNLRIHYLRKAGYADKGLLEPLKIIHNSQFNLSNYQTITYLNTHPSLKERSGYIGNFLCESKTPMQQIENENNSKTFDLFQTKIIALYGVKDAGLKKFKAALEIYPNNDIANYGYSLMLSRLKKWHESVIYMYKAINKNKNKNKMNHEMVLELGKIYFKSNQYKKALILLEHCPSKIDSEGTFYLALIKMAFGNLDEAKKNLNH